MQSKIQILGVLQLLWLNSDLSFQSESDLKMTAAIQISEMQNKAYGLDII